MAADRSPNVPRLQSFTLGDWLVDPRACHVARGDTVVKLRAQLVDLLVCLARRAGEIALKDEILAEVWPGQYIAESGLSRCIAELRQVLHDDAQQPRYIETITKRGYRLVAPVVWVAPQESAAEEPAKPDAHRVAEAGVAAVDVAKPDARGAAEAGMPTADVAEAARSARPMFARRGVWAASAVVLLAAAIVAIVSLRRAPAKVLLTERDPVLLAFENRTGDAVFDETIPLAVSIQLEQSPYLALLPPARVQEALRMMKRPADTPITRAVGLEACERLGGRALIVTSISRLGAQYVIGLEAVACGTGSVLARQQATTERKERVLDGLQRAAGDIRLAVGESAASLQRYQLPIDEATTVSLDALRAVRRGDVARERGQIDLAVTLYREAVGLDADFALAQGRLGRVANGAERVTALEKAYALRQRVTLPERLEIEASYHMYVTGDPAAVMQALELLRQSYPRRAWARRSLATEHMTYGRYDAGLAEALEAVRIEPSSAQNLAVVARAHFYLNHLAEARQVAESALAAGGVAVDLHLVLYWCALETDDAALLAQQRAWAAGQPAGVLQEWLADEAEESVNHGRLEAAIGFMTHLEALATAENLPGIGTWARFQIARYEALCGLGTRAMGRVETELRRNPGPGRKMDAVKVATSAGRFDMAERLLDEMDRDGQPGTRQPRAALARTYRATIAASRGRTREAIDLLAPLQPSELAWLYGFEPLFARAHAHYLAGDWSDARAAFEKILANWMINSGRTLQPFAQLGLARTLARAGDLAGSRRTYEQFFERWRGADAGLPVLLEARREYGALPK